MPQVQPKVKNVYSISYRNHVNVMKYSDIKAYTEKQALFIFFKYHSDCMEVVQISKY